MVERERVGRSAARAARCGLCFAGPSVVTVQDVLARAKVGRSELAVAGTEHEAKHGRLRGVSAVLRALLVVASRVVFVVLARTALPVTIWRMLQLGAVAGAVLPGPQRSAVAPFLAVAAGIPAYTLAASCVAPAHARSVEFWTKVIPIYMAYKYTQVVTPMLREDRRERAWNRRHEWGAEAVYRLCVEMRGFYLKDGQFIGSRADFIPEQWGRKLALLQDRVPPEKFELVRAVVCAEWGINSVNQVLKEVRQVPLASATVAQVHRAVTRKGREVVIKVQYADQEGLMQLDLRNLRNLAQFLQNHDMQFFDLMSVVREFETQIPLEFDFEEEARMMRVIGGNLRAAGICPQKVVVPELEESMITRRVLVMEFLKGVRVDDAKTLSRWGVDVKAIAYAIGEAYGRMMLLDGLFHADPHPGNLLVLPDGRVGLIDFGQCKKLDDDMRLRLCAFFLSLTSGDPRAVARTLAELGVVLEVPAEHSEMRKNYLAFIYSIGLFDTGPLPDGIEINPFAETSPLREVPISNFPPELFMVLRTMGLLRALCVTMNVELAMSDVFRPFALTALRSADPLAKRNVVVPNASTRPLVVQRAFLKLSQYLLSPAEEP